MPTRPVILDCGPLGRLVTPSPTRHLDLKLWYGTLREHDVKIILPAIIDYEVRRNLVLEGLTLSLGVLDRLGESLGIEPMRPHTLKAAAELWARARREGFPGGHPHDIDVDVIVAALAQDTHAIVATDNVAHFARFVDARPWSAITPAVLRA